MLLPAVREGRKIVSPGPSCTLVLRTEYPELVGTSEAREVPEAVMDLSDFLLQQARHKKLPKGFKTPIGKVAYHVACHNRVQNLGYRGRDLLTWAGADVATSGQVRTAGAQARVEGSLALARLRRRSPAVPPRGHRGEAGAAHHGRALHDLRVREPAYGEVPDAGDPARRADHRGGPAP